MAIMLTYGELNHCIMFGWEARIPSVALKIREIFSFTKPDIYHHNIMHSVGPHAIDRILSAVIHHSFAYDILRY